VSARLLLLEIQCLKSPSLGSASVTVGIGHKSLVVQIHLVQKAFDLAVSLEKRAEATYAEYRRQKRAGREDEDSDYLFGNFFRLPAFR